MAHHFYYQGKDRPNIPKLVPLLDVYPEAKQSAMMWHDCKISEDGKTLVTSSHGVHPSDPIGHLLDVWDEGIIPDPKWESCAGHFGRYLARSYDVKSAIDKPWLKDIAGGFIFKGNHLTLSHGFGIHTSDLVLARVLLLKLSEMYSSEAYKHAVKLNNKGEWGIERDPAEVHLYYSKLTGFVTARPERKALFDAFMNKTRTLGHDHCTQEHWAAYCMEEAEYLGQRVDVDIGAVLREKLDNPNEYFNQILPVDYAAMTPRKIFMVAGN